MVDTNSHTWLADVAELANSPLNSPAVWRAAATDAFNSCICPVADTSEPPIADTAAAISSAERCA